MKRTVTVHSVEETWALARTVAAKLKPGMVLALQGDLGAGKTTFMQGIGGALGVRRPVTSPTFTLSVEYPTPRFKLVHMDLYRLSGPDDLLTIGYPEYLESGAVVAVEWPERAGELIPPDAVRLTFSLTPDAETRNITIEGLD
ncbi:MAG: tRNA (adenosine(37)-N6)-threonylcarbamoyltransferase complex ATPase subunit type 1 TsaE [Kiritimatiellae bacterium]|nr:tRNA (adenosine(37)-N6)-threonylcarbamoyltransferase complex ATPase subunit type 1 TsaE [Kiritimatiellia bacterium]MBP5227052.1 tRNA (adenosine(37)-N6)-threonylcarbamoyltransferase complex ATPase subunit type 1 TsaE [Kiritimatiellia bacterium]